MTDNSWNILIIISLSVEETNTNGEEEWLKYLLKQFMVEAIPKQTLDEGYIIADDNSGNGYIGAYLIKTNISGNSLWAMTFGGEYDDGFYEVQQTLDGGYIMRSVTTSFGNSTAVIPDVYLIKTDENGEKNGLKHLVVNFSKKVVQ